MMESDLKKATVGGEIIPERHFSHSSMSTWRRCKARYKWSYIDNYQTKSSIGQLRGSAGHAALASWYTYQDVDKAVKIAADMFTSYEIKNEVLLEEDWDLTKLILKRYFAWSLENDTFEEVLALEQKFEFRINNHTIIGYIDGVVRSGESLWLLENKFNKRVETKSIDLDMQVSMYLLACYRLGIDVRGVLYNIIRVAEGGIAAKEPVVRRKIYRNQEGLAFMEKEMAVQLDEMSRFHRKGGVGGIYRNKTRDCSWDCGFYAACLSLDDNGSVIDALSSYPRGLPEETKGEDGE